MTEHPINIICDRCGKIFHPGYNHDGILNGMTFKLADGTLLTYCAECIIKRDKKRKGKEGTDND
jgi:hypothetical protein